jgi:hypothetical protein
MFIVVAEIITNFLLVYYKSKGERRRMREYMKGFFNVKP